MNRGGIQASADVEEGVEEENRRLREAVARLEKANAVLMRRVEQELDRQAGGDSIFHTAVVLESKVLARTEALEQAVSQQRLANQQLARAKEEADAANRSKGEFLAMMSHEIRTPLNGVVGAADLLEQTPLASNQRRLVETVRDSAQGLLSVINHVLDFSKIEASHLHYESIPFDAARTLEDAAVWAADSAWRKGLEVVCDLDPCLPPLLVGDPGRLRQIVLNLVGNAVKFTEEGEVLVTADHRDGYLTVVVQDTGIGMSPEEQVRAFEPFGQADGSTTRRFGGTGLGLPIARRLTEGMSGTLELSSEPGRGSRFSLMIPCEAPEAPPPPPLPRARALLVDPHDRRRAGIAAQLQAWGLEVASAAGADRLAVAEADIVLLHDAADGLVDQVRGWRDRGARALVLGPAAHAARHRQHPGLEPDAFLALPLRRRELRLELARLLGAADSHPQVLPVDVPHMPGLRVLVAEDHATNMAVVTEMLESLGCTALCAVDGGAALELLRSEQPDVVLMDWQMARLDGLQATQRHREAEQPGRRLPIIMVTAGDGVDQRSRSLQAGVDDFLPKPFQLADLRRTLGRWAAVAQPQKELERADLRPLEQLSASRDAAGRRDLFQRVWTIFRTDAHKSLEEAIIASGRQDAGRLQRSAHALKGIAGSAGATRLMELAAQLEESAREEDRDDGLLRLFAVRAEFPCTLAAMEQALRGEAPA